MIVHADLIIVYLSIRYYIDVVVNVLYTNVSVA